MRPLGAIAFRRSLGIVTVLSLSGWCLAQPMLPAWQDHAMPTEPPTSIVAIDVQETDAFIWDVFTSLDVARYNDAVVAYFSLLEQLDRPLSPTEQAVLLKHLRPLAMILAPSWRSELGLDAALDENNTYLLSKGIGRQLVTWWRRQDNLPATVDNERVEEHLARIVIATRQYRRAEDVRGFDDRGEIFVRLGAPSHSTIIELRNSMLMKNAHVNGLPDNEFWVYRHVDPNAQYLFIQRTPHQPFRLGFATDLIPYQLQGSPRKTDVLLEVMEEVYAQLALNHGEYGVRYDEVNQYLASPPPHASLPHVFAFDALTRARSDDDLIASQRARVVPASFSETYGPAEPLTVSVRWARFLDPDGTTRTEIYWGHDAKALQPSRRLIRSLRKGGERPSNAYLLLAAVMHRRDNFHIRSIHSKQYLLPARKQATFKARTLVVGGDTATYHLALQWSQQWIRPTPAHDPPYEPGATLKIGTVHFDSLHALQAHPDRLEMSDLKPLRLEKNTPQQDAAPYPNPDLSAQTPLAFYFEVYHLTHGSDDQTHYSIEYEIVRTSQAALPVLARPQEARTRSRTSYTGSSRIAREFIALDLSTWSEADEIEIIVRATDEITGLQVTRSISFQLNP